MPEQPDEVVPAASASDDDTAAREASGEVTAEGEASGSTGPAAEPHGSLPAPHEDGADEAERKARIEAAKRRYRATLRNEADSGGGGFSKDYYRSQKPPHWG